MNEPFETPDVGIEVGPVTYQGKPSNRRRLHGTAGGFDGLKVDPVKADEETCENVKRHKRLELQVDPTSQEKQTLSQLVAANGNFDHSEERY